MSKKCFHADNCVHHIRISKSEDDFLERLKEKKSFVGGGGRLWYMQSLQGGYL